MRPEEKTVQLAQLIKKSLTPLIDRDYALYVLPYYTNIGDTLIWEGEREMLRHVKGKCREVCGFGFHPDRPIKNPNTILLINGGGFMGDVWRDAWEAAMNSMLLNKDHKIIILPASIHYDDENVMLRDSEKLAECKNLTICLRDNRSFETAKKYFGSHKLMLVPDMAFCIPPSYLKKWESERNPGKTLFLKRKDKELADEIIPEAIRRLNPEIEDWPTMGTSITGEQLWFNRFACRLGRLPERIRGKVRDIMYEKWHRALMTKIGVRFLSKYDRIISTRLHVMILGFLLGRNVEIIDNSTGKLSAFYETWLKDCDNIGYFNK